MQESLGRMDGQAGGERWFSLRALGVSLVLVAVFAYFLPYWFLRLNLQAMAGGYLPVVAVFPVIVLLVINAIVRKLGIGLSRGEITVVLCTLMVSLGSLLFTAKLFTGLPSPVQGATAASNYERDFLHTVDPRVMPYQIEDKERSKSAGQFQENLNWFYSGISDPPAKEVRIRYAPTEPLRATSQSATATLPTLTPPPEVQEARVYLKPPPLKIPWKRWIRERGVDRDERKAAYLELGQMIRDAEGLEEPLRNEMVEEVDILQSNVDHVLEPRELAYPEGVLDAYDTMLKRLGGAREIDAETRAKLRTAIEETREPDEKLPRWRWTPEVRKRRLAAYDDLVGTIESAENLEEGVAREMLDEVKRLRQRQGAQQPVYRTLLKILGDVREHAFDPLTAAIGAAGELENARNTPVLPVRDTLQSVVLGSMRCRLGRLEPLSADRAAAMRAKIEQVEEAWRAGTPAQPALEQLSELIDEAKESETATWWAGLERRIKSEQLVDFRRRWWHWDKDDARERVEAYLSLKEALRASSLPVGFRRNMVEQVHTLIRNGTRMFSGDASAYARLSKLLRESRGIARADRLELQRKIEASRDADRYAAHYLEGEPRGFYVWTGPLLWWMILLVLIVLLQFCIASILRRQWVDHEKLLFPHAEILESTFEPGASGTPGGVIVRNRMFWAGFALAVALFTIEGVHVYWPEVPGLDLRKEFTLEPVLTSPPWNAMPAALDLHLFIIAIAFILPAEMSFSVWVFVLLDFVVRIYMRATGQTYHVYEPIQGYLINGGLDQLGGLTVFIIALMIGARRHLAGVLKKAFFLGREVDDSQEPIPYFGAFWGIILSAVAILVWCDIMGMNLFISFLLFALTMLGVMFIARVVCELGIVTGSYQDQTTPQYLIAGSFGYQGTAGKTFLGLPLYMTPTYTTWTFLWQPLFYGIHVMPLVMTSDRLYRPSHRRRFAGFLLVLTLVVMGVFAVRSIQIPYEEGALRLKQGMAERHGHGFRNCLQRDFIKKESMHKPFKPRYLTAIAGAIVMGVLLLLRHLFYWWPLHPIGYICVGLSGGVWFSVFIGWLIKRAALKYGGGRLFRKAIPFFVGLLVGHFVIGGIWLIVGVWRESMGLDSGYSAIWHIPYGRSGG
ncbi:MAG: DUF6785 family protein [Planctomycetota bacterium]